MAITFHKKPLSFFNVNEPAIFEFSSDEDLGANPFDLVADLELKSLWSSKRYVIKNIQPNYNTNRFRVDASSYLKSLLLDLFQYGWNNSRSSIERFQIGVSVHAENASDTLGDAYVFDSGYIFDETFIFAEAAPNDTDTDDGFYPILGLTVRSEKPKPAKDIDKCNILAPEYVEFAKGMDKTLSVLVGDPLAGLAKNVIVDGVNSPMLTTRGVRTPDITDAQVDKMYLPTLITTTYNNDNIKVYGVSYKETECEETMQFRFYNSYGGFSYFHTPKEGRTADRTKSDFINSSFYNQQENKPDEIQRSVDFNETYNLTGIKILELGELFRELLRSPKVEVLLPKGFTECSVKGSYRNRTNDFEYTLTVDVANVSQMSL